MGEGNSVFAVKFILGKNVLACYAENTSVWRPVTVP